MHSLFGITFVLFLLKLSAGKGFWKNSLLMTAILIFSLIIIKATNGIVAACRSLGSPILIVVSVIRRDQCTYYLYYVIVY